MDYSGGKMVDRLFQRKGAVSNTQVGGDFETTVLKYFSQSGMNLDRKRKHPQCQDNHVESGNVLLPY
jgi:hypothetical protein